MQFLRKFQRSNLKPEFIRLGINDTYSKGNYQFLKDKHGLSVDKIVKSIKKKFSKYMDNKEKYKKVFKIFVN